MKTKIISELEKEVLQRKWEDWAKKYPLACEIMFGEDAGKLKRIERMLKTDADNPQIQN